MTERQIPFKWILDYWIESLVRFFRWIPRRWKCLMYDHDWPEDWTGDCKRCGSFGGYGV